MGVVSHRLAAARLLGNVPLAPGRLARHRRASRVMDPSEPVVLASDGRWTNDSPSITGSIVRDRHHYVTALWEPAVNGEPFDSQADLGPP